MAYKIQELDSDSVAMSVSAKIESKNKKTTSNPNQGIALMGMVTEGLDQLHDQIKEASSRHSDEEGGAPNQEINPETLADILGAVAALTYEIQQWEAKFQSEKSTMENGIGKAAIDSANAAANKLNEALQKAAQDQQAMGILGIFADIFQGIMAVVALATGQVEMFVAMVVLFTLDKTGATQDMTSAIAKGLESCGCSKELAQGLSEGITCIIEVAVTLGICLGTSMTTAAMQAGKTASTAAMKEAITTEIKNAVQQAVKEAVETAAKDGASPEVLETVMKDTAQAAAKEVGESLSQTYGSTLVKECMKDGIKEGLQAGIKDAMMSLEKEGEVVAKNAVKQAAKKVLAKTLMGGMTVINDISSTVTKEMTQVEGKAYTEFSQALKNDLSQRMKNIGIRRSFAAAGQAGCTALVSTGFVTQMASLCSWLAAGCDEKKEDKTLQSILTVLFSLMAMIGAAVAGSGAAGESNISGVTGGAEEVSSGSNRVVQMLRGMFSKMLDNPAQLASKAEFLLGTAQSATSISQGGVSIDLSTRNQQIAESQPEMQVGDAIAKFAQQRMQADQKFFAQMYEVIPLILQNAISIAQTMSAEANALAHG
ncbi:MAG: hypothetical protein K9M07_01790 [Simkaniaceae bacterium]|nr:hypothetical protein [Simkaniaceae bacterium]